LLLQSGYLLQRALVDVAFVNQQAGASGGHGLVRGL
jgi:hypothetical protein